MGQTGAMAHVSVAEHRAALVRLVGDAPVERVTLDRYAVGRRLAADLVALDDLPRFDGSAMDGYAVWPAEPEQRTLSPWSATCRPALPRASL